MTTTSLIQHMRLSRPARGLVVVVVVHCLPDMTDMEAATASAAIHSSCVHWNNLIDRDGGWVAALLTDENKIAA